MFKKLNARKAGYVSMVIVIAVVMLGAPGGYGVASWGRGTFEIHVFNVGQADSQFIVSPEGKTLLIDLGETMWNSRSNCDYVAGKIRQIMGPTFNRIDYILTTHAHTDHIGMAGIGGIWALIETHKFTVGKLIERDSGVWKDANGNGACEWNEEIEWHNAGTTSGTAKKWICYATDPGNASRLNREIARPGSTNQVDLGGGVAVKIVMSDAKGVKMKDAVTPVSGDHTDDVKPPSENDYSITLKITYRDFSYVTGGDTDGEYATSSHWPQYLYNDVESVIAADIGKVDVMRVNHHGSSHSTNAAYFGACNPMVSIISCGRNNYGHPSQAVLNRVLTGGKVYITGMCDECRDYGGSVIVRGDIVISTIDGITYTVNGDRYTAGQAVPADNAAKPRITKFTVLVNKESLNRKEIIVKSFNVDDSSRVVTGYLITGSSARPSPNARGWSSLKPINYLLRSSTMKVIYGWVKDARGNVSEGKMADVWIQP
ncbi:MAG: hypothetical protein JW807_14250 [Spirochaetes bacterium]|nr:hypothetical protein [Spirochaetota bacterium]